MATLVEHEETGRRYVLLGAGLGVRSHIQQRLGLGGSTKTLGKKSESVVAVCDEDGEIGWFKANELAVISVDGVSPNDILAS